MLLTAVFLASLADPEPITDNSFLIEEAFNQEAGVVQHISTFVKFPGAERWVSTFTQEWPIDPAPRHQLSYTLSALSGASSESGGFADTLLNWRYQAVNNERIAFAPRASLLVPTGDWEESRSVGGFGAEINMPVSYTTGTRFDFHWNAGALYIPRTKNQVGDVAATLGTRVGQGIIWRAHPRIDGMLEILWIRQQVVAGPDDADWETSFLVNPGLRWAHDLSNGLQIVPGLSFPIELEGDPSSRAGVFFYISFEHSFRR